MFEEMIITGSRCGKNNEGYDIVMSMELLERANKEDGRIGIAIAREFISGYGPHWVTWEYSADDEGRYYWGHYFMNDEPAAWADYFDRCKDMIKYAARWQRVKAEGMRPEMFE